MTAQSTPILLAQAAEAKIFKQDTNEGQVVIKDRINKGYRHPILDKKLIKSRTKKEAKLLEKASELIPVPKIIKTTENKIEMQYLDGKKLSENLESLDWKKICRIIGNQIALLHDNNIIHGDLTTSNMILVEDYKMSSNKTSELKQDASGNAPLIDKNKANKRTCAVCEQNSEPKLYFIDFGLGFISERIEDKAVDLHLIKQALEAKHFSIHKEAEKIILENYNSKERDKILEQLKKVEARGRYRKNAA